MSGSILTPEQRGALLAVMRGRRAGALKVRRANALVAPGARPGPPRERRFHPAWGAPRRPRAHVRVRPPQSSPSPVPSAGRKAAPPTGSSAGSPKSAGGTGDAGSGAGATSRQPPAPSRVDPCFSILTGTSLTLPVPAGSYSRFRPSGPDSMNLRWRSPTGWMARVIPRDC